MKYTFTFLAFIYIHLLSAQEYNYRHYTADNGLPDSETYHVFQDSKGYIWIATDNGVCRYDGYEFEHFTEENGLPDNTVFEIFEDYKGRIWLISHSAQFSYWYNDSIHEYKYNDVLLSKMEKQTTPAKRSFYVDSLDQIYYGDKLNGGFFIDNMGVVKELISENKGHIMFAVDEHLIFDRSRKAGSFEFKIEDKDSLLLHLDGRFAEKYFRTDALTGLIKGNNILVASKSVLMTLYSENFNYRIVNKDIIWINADLNNDLWIGTRNGAYCFRNLDISKKPSHHILQNKNVSSVLRDSEGGYWFTTLYDGVYYLPNLNNKSTNYLSGNNVNSLFIDSSKMWFGLDNKVIERSNKNSLQTIQLDKKNVIIQKIYSEPNKDKVWILSRFLYSLKDSLTKYYFESHYKMTFKSPQPKDIKTDAKGNIWVATSQGLYKFLQGSQFTKAPNTIDKKINCITLDHQEQYLYCGTIEGLWKYNIDQKTFTFMGNQNDLFNTQIDCIINNPFHQNIWLGTKSKGIVVFDKDTIFNISKEDGLTGNNITSFSIHKNVIWVGTNKGLNRITLHDENQEKLYSIHKITKINGLLSNEINDLSIDDSTVYVASKEGLNLIDYHHINTNLSPPKIHFKRIQILDTDTILKDHYELPYDKNSLTIEYVGLTYRNNENKRYKYQFHKKGHKSKNWTEISENYVNLSYLPPGNYTFKVKSINEDHIESIKAAEVNFTIHPPYWKTWWFISAVTMVVILTVYLLYKSRITELNRRNAIENKLLKDVNKFQQQALSQQMNPHFIFNTLNSIQYYIYNNDVDSSVGYLNKFSKLMRLILDNSQKETISIQNELDAVELYLDLESLRLDNQLHYEIKVDQNLDTFRVQTYPLLLQPYVENAIIHGLLNKKDKKELTIELKAKKDAVMFIIQDNGIGRKKALEIKRQKEKTRQSHGTNITGKRIDIINKLYHRDFKVDFIDIQDEEGNPSGTRVVIEIPKINAY